MAKRDENRRGIATLIQKDISFVTHELRIGQSNIANVFVEIIPNKVIKDSIFILNIYSAPRFPQQSFHKIISTACAQAGRSPILIAGDFNAPHTQWGYPTNTSKGTNLANTADDHSLVLITDTQFPTRVGTSVTRDTTPDLTFVRNASRSEWLNTQENLGSDHFILATTLTIKTPPPRTQRVTDWDLFRKLREERQETQDGLEAFLRQIQQDVEKATKSYTVDVDVERLDSRLAHMLEAKNSILKRWRTNRHNRALRKKLAVLNREICQHAEILSRQKWHELCTSMEGQINSGGKWNLLKHLLDESKTKSNQRLAIDRTIHKLKTSGQSEADILQSTADKYLPLGNASEHDYPAYSGASKETLDAPFTISEVAEVLYKLNTRSAPGPDRITNKSLRNLDPPSIERLTEEINEIWSSGCIPDTWKHASVILIPKPGKASSIDNMRPISLTSCVGKAAEHVIHNRISRHIEDEALFTPNMAGFRPGLSTQDIMLMLKKDILDSQTKDVKGVLALDLAKAFDTIKHRFILEAISKMDLGTKFHSFVRSFLKDRRATIKVGQIQSEQFTLGAKGTPQGAVLSPLLFNIAMLGLSKKLQEIPDIRRALRR